MFPTDIPDELVLHIFSFLPLSDQLQFSQTCSTAQQISNERSFWRPRIHALAPHVALEPTKQHFLQVFRRALNETAFFTKNHAKITAILALHPERMAEFNDKLRLLQTLCLNPWGECCIENLRSIQRLLVEINENIVQAQIPATGISLRFECLTQLPSTIIERHRALFSQLQKCELQDNLLECLPNNIDILQNCCSLNLYNNPMRYIPKSLENMQNLAFMYFSEGNMPHIPNPIYKLKNLQWLSFSHMGLTSLSTDIGHLKNLTWLYLRDNQLSVLPEAFYKLTKLKEVFLEHNPLSALQYDNVLKLLRKIQCDVHGLFKTQFAMLAKSPGSEPFEVNDLVERFDLLSMTPMLTTHRAQRKMLVSSGTDLGACSKKAQGYPRAL